MKHSTKILGVALLTALYCFAVGATAYVSVHSDYGQGQVSGEGQYLSSISKSLFSHTSESESAVGSFNEFPTPDFKDSFNPLGLSFKGLERALEVRFVQYRNFSLNFPIRYRKSDLIFPFHYFW